MLPASTYVSTSFFKVCIYLHGCVNVSVYQECAGTPRHRRMTSDPLELELMAIVSCRIWGWESNLGSSVLLAAKSSLQPLERSLDWKKFDIPSVSDHLPEH